MIIYFDEYETYKYREIKKIIIDNDCAQMWDNQREFLNGIIIVFVNYYNIKCY